MVQQQITSTAIIIRVKIFTLINNKSTGVPKLSELARPMTLKIRKGLIENII
jgi:hypothetical protein